MTSQKWLSLLNKDWPSRMFLRRVEMSKQQCRLGVKYVVTAMPPRGGWGGLHARHRVPRGRAGEVARGRQSLPLAVGTCGPSSPICASREEDLSRLRSSCVGPKTLGTGEIMEKQTRDDHQPGTQGSVKATAENPSCMEMKVRKIL